MVIIFRFELIPYMYRVCRWNKILVVYPSNKSVIALCRHKWIGQAFRFNVVYVVFIYVLYWPLVSIVMQLSTFYRAAQPIYKRRFLHIVKISWPFKDQIWKMFCKMFSNIVHEGKQIISLFICNSERLNSCYTKHIFVIAKICGNIEVTNKCISSSV